MKNIITLSVIPLFALFLSTGCNSVDYVAKPSDISLASALRDVGSGLAEMKAAEINTFKTNTVLNPQGTNDFITGLFPSEVDVTFNVTRGASNANQLSIDLSSPPTIPVVAKVGDTYTTSATASRGNQITIKFMSAYFTSSTTTTTATNGTKVAAQTQLTDATKLAAFLKVVKGNNGIQDLQ